VAKPEREIIMQELEKQIRDLQKELAEVQKGQAVLRLQPCRGDSEIRKKDAKFDELDRRAKIINETIRDLTRKLQLLISQSNKEASCDFPSSSDSS
jgi:archaellum component FlaC